MGYPDNPNFMSGNQYAAWFIVIQAVNGQPRVRLCGTQGLSFLKRLQAKLNSKVVGADASSSLSAYAQIPITGTWDAATANLLAGYATNLYNQEQAGSSAFRWSDLNPFATLLTSGGLSSTTGQTTVQGTSGWSTLANRLRTDWRNGEVSPEGLRFALWVAYLDGTSNTVDSVRIDPNTIYPRFGVQPDNDRNTDATGAATCWYPDADPTPVPQAQQNPVGPQGQNVPGQTGAGQMTLGGSASAMVSSVGSALSAAAPVIATVGVAAVIVGGLYYWSQRGMKKSSGKGSKGSKRSSGKRKSSRR